MNPETTDIPPFLSVTNFHPPTDWPPRSPGPWYRCPYCHYRIGIRTNAQYVKVLKRHQASKVHCPGSGMTVVMVVGYS